MKFSPYLRTVIIREEEFLKECDAMQRCVWAYYVRSPNEYHPNCERQHAILVLREENENQNTSQ
jgi:hypothetical protein